MQANNKPLRFAVLGSGGVGKSASTLQLIAKHFVEYYDPTVEDSYLVEREIDGRLHEVSILDTAGQEEFRTLRDEAIRGSKGFLVVYSIISRESFEEAVALCHHVLRVKDSENVPMVLMGNKCDLVRQREVSTTEGREFASSLGISFFETSARTRENLDEAFDSAIRLSVSAPLTGFLKKKSPCKLGLYQSRFFTIQRGHLCYFKTECDAHSTSPLGRIPLDYGKGLKKIEWDMECDRRGFRIEVEGRVFEIKAENENEARRWVAGLEDIVSQCKTKPTAQEMSNAVTQPCGLNLNVINETQKPAKWWKAPSH